MTERNTLNHLSDEMFKQFNEHGNEIRELADKIDEREAKTGETPILDTLEEEIKLHYSQKSKNERDDDDDDVVQKSVSNWMEANIENSTERAIAAIYVLLGREGARRRLGESTEHTYSIEIDEIQHLRRVYVIDADSENEATEKALIGDTLREETIKIVSVVDRKNAVAIKA